MIKEISTTKLNGIKSEDCAIIAEVANRFKSDIFIIKANKKANAKSIMGLLSLNIKQNELIYLSVSGEDETKAIEALIKLL